MRQLEGALRSYAWGSRTALAELCGRPSPSAHPEAELWLGAHPGDPARVIEDNEPRSLWDVVAEAPRRELGERSIAAFGERLPFLLKVLAAEEPLSLQAHPSAEQAREGFEREERSGVPADSPMRNYRDGSHKPELVVALTRFEALAGFRDPHRTVRLLGALDVPELENYVALLAGQPDPDGLRALFTTWITLPPHALAALLPRVLDGCVGYLSSRTDPADTEFVPEVRTALELSEGYPGDAGVLASLLLNRVTLEPGQGLFLDAGNLHAYLHGTAVEIMANSDNVLRGGLTPKHVDVPELLRVLDFESVDVPVLTAEGTERAGEFVYRTPAPEFMLSRIDLDASGASAVAVGEVDSDGPQILLCTSGAAKLSSGSQSMMLERGAAAWISAADNEVQIQASAEDTQIFRAGVGALLS
ncbi:mannose-6-phosphate isomerase, class I [Rhodococcus sp. ABRD24]|uniref:mannose-6-phosphate isomerase, class I n=1 Tax=Rhodococcus sp. ABRD24 TaxID=2507582 RepID=UPI00103CDDA8|nr:mannose-6-phosphate isomerase, class I [Rhodococcus sp. ABRD24]QBJ95336.1 mannose-6-phosphate isomerase, class I [Rhodococcus sp. ABRD24]